MNNAKAAAALNTISVAFGELAEALTDEAVAPVSAAPRATRVEPDTSTLTTADPVEIDLPDEVFTQAGEGSLSQCPKHHKPYLEGNFGPYCPSLSDDPAWANRKGYCRITPRNAATWLKIQAA